MGVPNTTTFELQDVVDEINPTTDDLVDCFSDATASYFDSSYEGSKNQLLNFRNYGSQNALTQFTGSSGQNDFKFLCSQSTTTNYWHNGSGPYPVVGDIVYTNASGTATFGPTYMRTSGSFSNYFLQFTGSAGEVGSTGSCSPP